jgi:CubicO group peptidase (beta-lactamase class C family)
LSPSSCCSSSSRGEWISTILSTASSLRCAVAEGAARRGEPGGAHHYSNTIYVLLGDIVQQVTGRPRHDEVRSHIVEPLGLAHTGVIDGVGAGLDQGERPCSCRRRTSTPPSVAQAARCS